MCMCACAHTCLWRLEDSLLQKGSSFLYVAFGIKPRSLRLGGKIHWETSKPLIFVLFLGKVSPVDLEICGWSSCSYLLSAEACITILSLNLKCFWIYLNAKQFYRQWTNWGWPMACFRNGTEKPGVLACATIPTPGRWEGCFDFEMLSEARVRCRLTKPKNSQAVLATHH